MKKAFIGFGICLCLFSLAGCGNGKNESEKNSKSSVKTTVTSTKDKETSSRKPVETSLSSEAASASSSSATAASESTAKKPTTLWDAQKSSELQTFMTNWSAAMGQNYQSYQPGNRVDFYGLKLPDDVLGEAKRQPVAVGGQIVTAAWSDNGTSAAEYSIVAVYSDAATAPYTGKHVYFFGFHNSQPIVLVSMQNQGMPDGALHFDQTENNDLNTGFDKIAVGQIVEQSAQESNTWSSMDEAIQFYENVYQNPSNEIGKGFIWANYDRKCWEIVEHNGNRIVLHWSNIGGAGGSYDEFIKNGDTTDLIFYDGNISYPRDPSMKYTIQNSNHKVIKTEELWKK